MTEAVGSLVSDNPPEAPTTEEGVTETVNGGAPTEEVAIPENWKMALPEEFRNDPSLGSIVDIQGLAKSYVNAQKMIGGDKIMVPNKYDDGSQLREALHKLGLPGDVGEYKIKAAEGVEEEKLSEFVGKAHEIGILPKQAEALFNHIHENEVQSATKMIEKHDRELLAEQEELKKEWGQGFQAKVDLASNAVQHFAGEDKELMEYLTSVDIGGDPKLVKFFSKVGEMLKEDGIINEATGNLGKTPAEAETEINSIMGNLEHPYHNSQHQSHKDALAEVQNLFNMVHGN